jgi:3-oxoacyl-[acyl-carrier protein] reductase
MVIISGGCGGVGSAIGKQLAEDGFDIVALYNKTPKDAAEAVIHSFPGNGKHQALHCDISDERAVIDMIATITKIEAVVHAAVGPVIRKNILEMSSTELNDQLAVSFLGGFYFLKAAAGEMKNGGGGAMIAILSRVVEPDVRYAKMAGVTIGKYALRGLLKELHGELVSSAVRVNAIAPDFMDTPLNGDLPPEVRKFIAERATKGSIKSPEEVARAVSFLLSKDGASVNGKIFSFDKNEITTL